MARRLLFAFLLTVCCKFSFAQKNTDNIQAYEWYKEGADTVLNKSAATGYLLIRLKYPQYINLKKIHPVKRVSYDTYIVKASEVHNSDKNIFYAVRANSLWKATYNLLQVWRKHKQSTGAITIKLVLNDSITADQLKKFGIVNSAPGKTVILKTVYKNLAEILGLDGVLFANTIRQAHAETPINDIDLGAGNITAATDNYPEINGTGINLVIKENLYDNTDLDIAGRTFNSFQQSPTVTQHATDMATLIGGGGNSYIKGLGTAPMVKFTSSTFANLSADTTSIFKTNNISVQNHSYGTGIENYYSDESISYDRQVNDDDTLVHVFSSGNIGTSAPTAGLYNGLTGYSNITGAFKQAKNVLVAGGIGRNNVPLALSSAGPAFDGRVLPQVVTDGEDGTSGSAALVSGTVVLMQQAYKNQFGRLPSAALVKAILINSADDIGAPGADFKTGYGKLNALEAIRTIKGLRFDKGSVTNGAQTDILFTVPAGSSLLKVSLAWDDQPAALNATKALVNDLDLSVSMPDGSTLLPWTLSAYPSADSLSKAATRKKDTLNTAEQVSLQNPPGGIYTIHIKGGDIPSGAQVFYIAKQVITANKFEWIFPAGNDHLFAADTSYLRWQDSYATTTTGKLSISYDHGATWQPISNITLNNKYFSWLSPNVFTTAMLKMEINGVPQVSREFSISKPLDPLVGYNCTSGTLLHWQPQAGATGYIIYNIKNNLLQKLAATTDTAIIIAAVQQSSPYFAVSAQGPGFEGIKSYTFNAAQQGVGCYIKTLLAGVSGNTILLNLTLGSVLNLKSITWEKLTGPGQYSALGTTTITSSLNYLFKDANPKNGIQYYRAMLVTTDGTIIYSDQPSATFLQPAQFSVFPNPVTTEIDILSGDINNYVFKLYNTLGEVSIAATLNNTDNVIAAKVASGVYVYVISLNGKVLTSGKLVKL